MVIYAHCTMGFLLAITSNGNNIEGSLKGTLSLPREWEPPP